MSDKSSSKFRVTVILADYCQVADGKMNMMGAWWDTIGPGPHPMAVALRFEVPWNEINKKHEFQLQLLTQDGQQLLIQTAEGNAPLGISGVLEVSPDAGAKEGRHLSIPQAVNFGPLPLPPGLNLV